MSGDVRAAVERLRTWQGAGGPIHQPRALRADIATLLAEHDRLAAADPVAVVAGVDLEGVLAGHWWWRGECWERRRQRRCDNGWFGEPDEHATHQAEQVRAALTEALRGEAQ